MTYPLACVIDASVVVKLTLAEPLAPQAIALFDRLAADEDVVYHVPGFFYVECANIFWKQCQRGNMAPARAGADLAALGTLRLRRTATFHLMNEALALALAHGITAYDACYVALAAREGVPLVTADEKLVRKMAGSPVAVEWLGGFVLPPP